MKFQPMPAVAHLPFPPNSQLERLPVSLPLTHAPRHHPPTRTSWPPFPWAPATIWRASSVGAVGLSRTRKAFMKPSTSINRPSPLHSTCTHSTRHTTAHATRTTHTLTSRLSIFNRWRVEIRPQNEVTGEFSESKRTVQYMFNYFNIGTDVSFLVGGRPHSPSFSRRLRCPCGPGLRQHQKEAPVALQGPIPQQALVRGSKHCILGKASGAC